MTGPVDDEARARVRSDLDSTLVVVAGAGTGKTTALVGRIVELVRTGRATLREIAAITFTEAAAAELRLRVRERIDEVATENPDDARLAAARHEVDEAAICTLHAFAQRILVEHCVAAGIPPGFEVLDETAERADFDARFEGFADALLTDPGAEPALVQGFTLGLVPEDLIEMARALNRHWDRLQDGGAEALEHMRPGPGAWPAADTGAVLDAIEAARATARWCTADDDKLREHLDRLGEVAHELTSCDDELSTLQYLEGLKLTGRHGQGGNWGGRIDDVREACARAEQARLDLLGATYDAVLGELGSRLASFVMTAADERRVEGRLGFHDLLVHARSLLRHDDGAVTSLRRRYRRLLIDEFQDTDPIQVELAARLAAAVDGSADLAHAEPGGLFVVGDPKQSIYRFRRADIELFARVGREIGEQIVLGTNFRSVPGILAFVNTVFAQLFGAEPAPGQAAHHDLTGERAPLPLRIRGATPGAGAGAATPSRPTAVPGSSAVQLSLDALLASPADAAPGRNDGGGNGDGATPARRSQPGGMPPVVVLGGPLPATITEVRRAAAHDVAVTVDDVVASRWAVMDEGDGAVRAARYGDVAVLLPARTALPALEEALEEARIPYRLEGVALLWGSDEVRDILAVLRAVDDPVDRMAVLGALRSPGLACGDDDLVTWRQAEGTWDPRDPAPPGFQAHPVALAMEVLARLHDERWWREPSAMVGRAFDELHSFELCLAYHRPRDHWQRLRWLRDQARLFDETVGGSLRSFLAWAEQQGEEDRRSGGVGPPDPDDDAVRIMTIHGSKGLEFPVVVLAGLEREVAPGARGPTVLWSEAGRPELRAGGPLRTLGFEDTNTRERELDTLEAYRLLYVAMTRARDHLVLCLHHKRLKENSTATPTIAARLQAICAASANLWRRLPLATLTPPDVADDEEAAAEALALIRAGFGLDAPPPPGSTDDDDAALAAGAGTDIDSEVHAWRAGVDAFATRRAEALAARRRAPVTTATAVADQVAHAAQPGGDAPRAGRAAASERAPGSEPDPGGPEGGEALWRDADTALQIGRAVHGALAVIDLHTGTDEAGRDASDVAHGRAVAHGVGDRRDAVAAMVVAALRAPTVVARSSGRHWRELFVAVPVGDGVLEGFVDLVLEDGDDLVVVDYKTDRIDGPAERALAAARYGPQVASYALALEAATGRVVRRCVLVFVGGGTAVEVTLEGAALDEASRRARRAAADLLAATAPGGRGSERLRSRRRPADRGRRAGSPR